MDDEKPMRVYKVTMRLQEGTMNKDDGLVLLPLTDLVVECLMNQDAAQDKNFRDRIAVQGMDAFWKKMGK